MLDKTEKVGYMGELQFNPDEPEGDWRIMPFLVFNKTGGEITVAPNVEETKSKMRANAIIVSEASEVQKILVDARKELLFVTTVSKKLFPKALENAAFEGVHLQNFHDGESGWSEDSSRHKKGMAMRAIADFASTGTVNMSDRMDLLLPYYVQCIPSEDTARIIMTHSADVHRSQIEKHALDGTYGKDVSNVEYISSNITTDVKCPMAMSSVDVRGDSPEKAMNVFAQIQENIGILRWRIAMFGKADSEKVNYEIPEYSCA